MGRPKELNYKRVVVNLEISQYRRMRKVLHTLPVGQSRLLRMIFQCFIEKYPTEQDIRAFVTHYAPLTK